MVLVIDAENLCQSLILSTIKEYSLYAIVVKLVTIQLEFLTIFLRSRRILLRSITLDRSIGDTRPRSCRTDVANKTADLSETPVQSQAFASDCIEQLAFFTLVIGLWLSLNWFWNILIVIYFVKLCI